MEGPIGWRGNATLSHAVEIQEGVIRNQKILHFQHREVRYPHRVKV